MKIQLDTENKTIKLDSNVEFRELINTLGKLLPKGAWKDFTLQTNVTINNWGNPYIIKETWPTWPGYPWYCGTDTISMGNSNTINNKTFDSGLSPNKYQVSKADMECKMELNPGVYNVQVKDA